MLSYEAVTQGFFFQTKFRYHRRRMTSTRIIRKIIIIQSIALILLLSFFELKDFFVSFYFCFKSLNCLINKCGDNEQCPISKVQRELQNRNRANTDLLKNEVGQVPLMSKHPLRTGHIRRAPKRNINKCIFF